MDDQIGHIRGKTTEKQMKGMRRINAGAYHAIVRPPCTGNLSKKHAIAHFGFGGAPGARRGYSFSATPSSKRRLIAAIRASSSRPACHKRKLECSGLLHQVLTWTIGELFTALLTKSVDMSRSPASGRYSV